MMIYAINYIGSLNLKMGGHFKILIKSIYLKIEHYLAKF